MVYREESPSASDFDAGQWSAERFLRPSFGNGREAAKRALDIVVALAALVFFAPFMIPVTLGILLLYGRPVIFAHQRIGRSGRSFACLKFRTMHCDSQAILERHLADNPEARLEWAETQKLKRDPRVHPIGRLLRKSSFDELPQLINVLLGDMSIVGPRPIVAAEMSHYGGLISCYTAVRPGITGLWQISGRNDTSYAERVQLDACYCRDRSLRFDIAIIIRTIPVVLFAKGAY